MMTNEVYKVGEKVDAVKKVTDGAVEGFNAALRKGVDNDRKKQ